MTLQEAVTILENHNKWRRGDDTLEMALHHRSQQKRVELYPLLFAILNQGAGVRHGGC